MSDLSTEKHAARKEMPFTEKDTKVARAVIDWLNSVAERAGAEEAESLLAASQCVQSVCATHVFLPSHCSCAFLCGFTTPRGWL